MRMNVALVLLAGGLLAQHQGHTPAARPAVLHPGLGDHHHPIRTAHPEAQRFFDQGLTLVFGFNHDEALRSFERAAALDPQSPMALWGVALVLGANYNDPGSAERNQQAYQTIQRALALLEGAPEPERDYVRALARRYAADGKGDLTALAAAYKDAMGEVMRKYPDDMDAATLYAEALMNLNPWKLWDAAGNPAPGTLEIVQVLEGVLRREPNHPGANHYYIHAIEASPYPERALASAERLKTLVPGAGHLVHMPGHIYLRTGDFEAAARTNAAAVASDRQMVARMGDKAGMYALMYANHNWHFIAFSRAEQGRAAEALAAAREMQRSVTPHLKAMPMLEAFAVVPLFTMARSHQWAEILKEPEPGTSDGIGRATWLFARTLALAGAGQHAAAVRERAAFEQARLAIPADFPWGGNNLAKDVFSLATHELDARLAEAAGNPAAAIPHWREAVRLETALVYDEPPPWYRPVRESLAAALFRTGDFAGAERVFRENLERNPRNPRSLFGLAESLKAQKKDASAIERQFAPLWKAATVKLAMATL
jgi:tetratricopeptide (TPR) repeat protein